MTAETFLLLTTIVGTFLGSIVGGFVVSTRTASKFDKRAGEVSQKMQVIKKETDEVDKRVKELEKDKAALEEIREARDKRITTLEYNVSDLEKKVQTITDEKAEVVRERDELRGKLTKAEGEIQELKISVIKLEARLEAEQNAAERIVKPIVEALARNSVHTSTGDTGRLNPAHLPADPPTADAA